VVIAGAIFGAEAPQTAPVHEPALQIKVEAEAVVKDVKLVVPVMDVHPPTPACLRQTPGLLQEVMGVEPPEIELTVHFWV
jgi:hypothetical protein